MSYFYQTYVKPSVLPQQLDFTTAPHQYWLCSKTVHRRILLPIYGFFFHSIKEQQCSWTSWLTSYVGFATSNAMRADLDVANALKLGGSVMVMRIAPQAPQAQLASRVPIRRLRVPDLSKT